MNDRLIELEHELVATRRAAVAIVHAIVGAAGLDHARIAEDLMGRAETVSAPEARLARLIAETLRRMGP